jgi:hypothetical protein
MFTWVDKDIWMLLADALGEKLGCSDKKNFLFFKSEPTKGNLSEEEQAVIPDKGPTITFYNEW